MRVGRIVRAGLACTSCAAALAAHAVPSRPLAELSLEELSNLEITSVSRRAERLSDAPTSVFVITAEDIRRSGATQLVEALRLAPNLQVVRVSNFEYNVTARGFASDSANKLLVLIDGRSVYSPLFSGVFWDVQELVLDDVERIEVISGPGGTLWGVNAVNGVINVITRQASSTAGTLVSASGGEAGSHLALRHGADTPRGAWRLYAARTDEPHTRTASGMALDDAGHLTQAGFRADAARGNDTFLLRGSVYRGGRDQPLPGTIVISGVQIDLGPITVSGGHLLGRWDRALGGGAALQAQAYVDHTRREVVPTFADRQTTLDLLLQHSLAPFGGHRAEWGAQLRRVWDKVDNSTYVAFLPGRLTQNQASLFAQDEITLGPAWQLTLGARAEHNPYTGTEFLPTARLAWKLAPQQLLWAAASRAVRAPSRLDHDAFVPGEPPFLLRGGPDVQSEVSRVVELGYRGQPTAGSSLSATLWHAEHQRLRTQEIDPSYTYVYFANGMRGRTQGVELWGSMQLARGWRLHAGYSRLWQDLQLAPGSNDAQAVAATEGANPPDWWLLRSSHDLPHAMELDLTLRHAGRLVQPEVPAYTTLDLRWGWRARPGLELALTGQNLTGGGHGEFGDVSTRMQLQRTWAVQAAWRF